MMDPQTGTDPAIGTDTWSQIARIVAAFDAAWLRGDQPAIQAFLPEPGTNDLPLLCELVHLDLEHRLKAGEAARVEDYLATYSALADDQHELVELLAAEFTMRRAKEPALSPEMIAARFQHLAPEIQKRCAALTVEKIPLPGKQTLPPPAVPNSKSGSDETTCIEGPKADVSGDEFALEMAAGLTLGDTAARLDERYEIQRPIGAGGMGEVWLATDRRLRRPVAIKRMKGLLATDRQASARFLREARAIAALNHPHIVQVFDFGYDRDGYYLVMEYVEGENLSSVVRRDGPLPPERAVRLTMQLCGALGAAHARGVIHRDVKPSNVLWTSGGVAKLTDFGLARLDQIDAEETQSGMLIGTLDYMAPEQRQDARRADARSDLWSLAATLYELVAGSPPRVICSDDLPGPLRSVLLKALATAPDARFAGVDEFARALSGVEGEMAAAASNASTPNGARCFQCQAPNDLSRKFCQKCGASLLEPCPNCREPLTSGIVFCGACGANVEAVFATRQAEFDREKVEIESLLSKLCYPQAIAKLELLVRDNVARLGECRTWATGTLASVRTQFDRLVAQREEVIAAAQQRIETHEYRAALRLLERIPEKLHDERSRALQSYAAELQQKIEAAAAEIRAAQRSKRIDGLTAKVERFLDLRPNDANARTLLDRLYAQYCVEVRRFEGGYAAVTSCIALFGERQTLLIGGADGVLRLADLRSGREIRRLTAHQGNVSCVGVSPDDKMLLSAGHDGTLRFWDSVSGRELHRCETESEVVACAVFSADGRYALSGGWDGIVRVWDVSTGRRLRSCEGSSAVTCLAPMPGAPCALTGLADGTLCLWNVRTATQLQTFRGHGAAVLSVGVSADGRYALSASGGQKTREEHLRLWSIETGEHKRDFAGAPPTRAVAITRDGRYSISAGQDSSVRLWSFPAGQEVHRYAGHGDELRSIAIAPNGQFAVSAGGDASIRVWRLPP